MTLLPIRHIVTLLSVKRFVHTSGGKLVRRHWGFDAMKTMMLIAVMVTGMVTAATVAQAGYTPMDNLVLAAD